MTTSIVIPTRNGADTLPAVLDAIARQRITDEIEIIAVDSSSTDATEALLAHAGAHVIRIATSEFDHGTSRNLGIARARGDVVVLLVQDAVPASDRWLYTLTQPLRQDERLAGTFARQIPRDDATMIARRYLARWGAASETPRTSEISGVDEFHRLTPMDRFARCIFDNVCSCIRRSVWETHPFRATPIAEDLEWAKAVLLDGYRLAYVPEAIVVHSHDRSASYELARTRVLHRRLYELFEMQTIPTTVALARAVGSSLAMHWKCQRQSPRRDGAHLPALWRGAQLAVAWPLGQFLGARDAIHERPRVRVPGV